MVKEAKRIAKGIFDGSITSGEIDPKLTALVAEEFRNAIVDGFGKDLPEIDYDTPDFGKLANLEKNVYQFSSAKNYQQLKSMTLALKDGDRIRTFNAFREEAMKIADVYIGPWLRTEYNNALTCAQMASKWATFQAQKDILPYLEFVAIVDGHTTDLCLSLNGIKLPVDHPLWDIIFLPNHWGERSNILATADGPPSDASKIVIPDIPKMFQTNMAKQGLAFPKGSAYYVDCPKEILQLGEDMLGDRITDWGKKFLAGEKVQAAEIGEVRFTEAGLQNLIEAPHQFMTEKNQVVYALKELVPRAPFAKTITKGDYHFHYFKIKIKGKPSWIEIIENRKGQKVVTAIVDNIP